MNSNNDADFISFIIPTLNEGNYIESTLANLKKLNIPHEVIVSDGASTDRTAELARKQADKVVVFSGSGRQTIAQGRNDGARAARGNFLVFFDADCSILDPDFFTKALIHFQNPKVVAITARLKVLPDQETFADRLFFGVLSFMSYFLNNVVKRGESPGEFQMIRREAFEKLGGFRGELVTREDADMFLRLSKIGRTVFDGKLVVFHTGRRAHKIGWPRLLWTWAINTVYFSLFNKAVTKEWKPIR